MSATNDIRWQSLVVESHQNFIIHQKIPPPGLLLQILDRIQHFAVTGNKRRPGLEIPLNQGAANKQIPALGGVNLGVGNTALGDHIQAIKCDLLVPHHLGTLLLPVGLKIVVLYHVACQRLHPFGLNGRHHSGKHLAGFDDLGRHNPLGCRLADFGARENHHLAVSGGQILPLFHFHRHLAKQAGQNGFMHCVVVGRLAIQCQLLLPADQGELAVNVPPLTHSHPAQEGFLAQFLELVLGQFLALLFEPVPDIQQGSEIRFLVVERCVSLVGRLLLVLWAFPGVLNAQAGNHNQHFRQTALLR